MIQSKVYTCPDLENLVPNDKPQLVFVYGSRNSFSDNPVYEKVSTLFPNSEIISLSTSGHFDGKIIADNVRVQVLLFESSKVQCTELNINYYDGASYDLGKDLAACFDQEGLKGIGIVSDGALINGSDLIEGINKIINKACPVFGGMAGDGFKFEKTLTGLNASPKPGNVVAYGLYGENLEIGLTIDNGWKSFGLEYEITKSDKNILHELDNQPAYDILHSLLGIQNKEEFVTKMLFFPFQLLQTSKKPLVRTPLFVDHEKKSITYAGDMPEGGKVRIMKAGTMKLLNSVVEAGNNITKQIPNPDVILMVSCVGRRAVMNKLTVEEGLDLTECFDKKTSISGYYSYGEFSQFSDGNQESFLHNQTLTLTALKEA